MTDSQESSAFTSSDGAGHRVAGLASRAIAELATRRTSQRPLLSERLMSELLAATLDTDNGAFRTAVTNILHTGIPKEEIVDLYIPEAARRLGDFWQSDGLGFAEVTIGSARLQRLVRDLSTDPRDDAMTGRSQTSILVVVRAGESHTLGAMVAASQLRRAGISVRLMLCEPDSAVLRAIAQGCYEAMLFSVGGAEKLAGCRDFVARSRDASSTTMWVGLGGAVGHLGDEARALAGVDFASADTREAVRRCGVKSSTKGARLRASSV